MAPFTSSFLPWRKFVAGGKLASSPTFCVRFPSFPRPTDFTRVHSYTRRKAEARDAKREEKPRVGIEAENCQSGKRGDRQPFFSAAAQEKQLSGCANNLNFSALSFVLSWHEACQREQINAESLPILTTKNIFYFKPSIVYILLYAYHSPQHVHHPGQQQ